MKKKSRIQTSSRKITAGETDKPCEKKKKLPGSRGRPRKSATNISRNVNSCKDANSILCLKLALICFIYACWQILIHHASPWFIVKKLIFHHSNRQNQYRHLPPLPWKVLSTQLATRLPVGSGCCWGVGCRDPLTPPVSHVSRGLPATSWGPIGSRPTAIRVCLQEVPHKVLQVPQHPDKVSAEGQPSANREREPYEPVSLGISLKCIKCSHLIV